MSAHVFKNSLAEDIGLVSRIMKQIADTVPRATAASESSHEYLIQVVQAYAAIREDIEALKSDDIRVALGEATGKVLAAYSVTPCLERLLEDKLEAHRSSATEILKHVALAHAESGGVDSKTVALAANLLGQQHTLRQLATNARGENRQSIDTLLFHCKLVGKVLSCASVREAIAQTSRAEDLKKAVCAKNMMERLCPSSFMDVL